MLQNWLGSAALSEWHVAIILWLARITSLGLAAALVATLVQRRSADVAHRVWITALAGILLLPLIGMIIPPWNLGINLEKAAEPVAMTAVVPSDPPPTPAENRPIAAKRAKPTPVAKTPNGPEQVEPKVDVVRPPSPEIDNRNTPKEVQAVAPDPINPILNPIAQEADTASPFFAGLDWLIAVWLLWAVVAAFLLLRLAVAIIYLLGLVRRASEAPAELQALLAETAQSLHVRQRYKVRMLSAGTMPMACWLGRWIVLLPEDIVHWPAALRWTVIAHEFGHFARRDAWWDLLTQFVCRVFWPNPALWLAGRAVPRLRERACDEWVLATGQIGAQAYAQNLLEVIARCTSSQGAMASPMARTGDLERRLRFVLTPSSPKWRSPLVKLSTVAGCLFLTAVLAAGQPGSRDEGPQGLTAAAKESSKVQRTLEPVPADGPAISVAGVVLTPAGKIVPGATVILRAKTYGAGYYNNVHIRDILARTKSDAEGRFAFDKIGIPLRFGNNINSILSEMGDVELLASADGWGLIWTDVKSLTPKEPVQLVLAPEAKVTGIVRDKTGRGVPDIRVELGGATQSTAEADGFFKHPGDLNLALSEVSRSTTTDAEGHFALRNLPPDFRFGASFEGEGFARQWIHIDTGHENKITEIIKDRKGKEIPVRRSPLEIVLERQRFARINVFDHAGKPFGSGKLSLIDSERHSAGFGAVNARGEAFIPIAKPGKFQLSYGGDPLQPRLVKSMAVDIGDGVDTPVFEFRLPEPIWLDGRVVDQDTGKGVVGAYISYGQKKAENAEEFAAYSLSVSGQDGSFRMPVAAGPGSLGIQGSVFGYFTSRIPNQLNPKLIIEVPERVIIDVPKAGKPEPVKLTIGRGLVIRGLVRDPEGKPLAGAVVKGTHSAITNAEGRFEMAGLSPRFQHVFTVNGVKGAGHTTVEADPDHPLTKTSSREIEIRLKLGVALTGRVLHNDQPKSDILVQLFRSRSQDSLVFSARPFQETKTDAQGRYRFEGMEVGDQYYVTIIGVSGMVDASKKNKGGKGNMRTVPNGLAEIVLPDVKLETRVDLQARSQTLRGVVVDPSGKPLAGIKIGAFLPNKKGTLATNTVTDNEGRFELLQLPDKLLELMAHKPPAPKGTKGTYTYTIKNPAYVRPTLNQQDIRIVFDPTLLDEVEDLDKVSEKADVWTLDVKFQPPQTIRVNIPGQGQQNLWFLRYEVNNNTKEPRFFVPKFLLEVDKVSKAKSSLEINQGKKQAADKKQFPAKVVPEAQEKLLAALDPTKKMELLDSVTVSKKAIPPGGKIQAVAFWDNLDLKDKTITQVTIYLGGLSNGAVMQGNKTLYKTLQTSFHLLIQNDEGTAISNLGTVNQPGAANLEWVYR